MNDPVRIVVHGAAGRMGQAVIRCILDSKQTQLACALVRPGSSLTDEPLSRIFGPSAADADFENSLDPNVGADVLVDFSGPMAFDSALAMARERRCALVSGTTGLGDEQLAALAHAANTIPVLWSANFSLGVAMLMRVVRRTAAALPDWDCDIMEIHHKRKEDAPSGTALALGQAAAEGRGIAFAEHAVYTRHDRTAARAAGEIGLTAMRGGDVVGEHTVMFATDGERLELTHRAGNRDIFARGALAAAIWIAKREPGLYAFDQVLAPTD